MQPRPLITAEQETIERLSREAMAFEATGDTARALAAISQAHAMLDLWRERLLSGQPMLEAPAMGERYDSAGEETA